MSGRIKTIAELKKAVIDYAMKHPHFRCGKFLEWIGEFEAGVKERIEFVEMFEGEETAAAELRRLLGEEE